MDSDGGEVNTCLSMSHISEQSNILVFWYFSYIFQPFLDERNSKENSVEKNNDNFKEDHVVVRHGPTFSICLDNQQETIYNANTKALEDHVLSKQCERVNEKDRGRVRYMQA